MDAGDLLRGEALVRQTLDTRALSLLRAKRADIENFGPESSGERRVVDLRIMGERDHRRARIEAQLRNHLVGPFGMKRDTRKPRAGGESAARVDDGDVTPQRLGDGDDALRDMHRADDDQAQRRIVDVDELPVMISRLVEAEGLIQFVRQRIIARLGACHDPLFAGGKIGDERHRLAVGAGGEKLLQQFALHYPSPLAGRRWTRPARPDEGRWLAKRDGGNRVCGTTILLRKPALIRPSGTFSRLWREKGDNGKILTPTAPHRRRSCRHRRGRLPMPSHPPRRN